MAQNKNLAAPSPFLIKEVSFTLVDVQYTIKQKRLLQTWIENTITEERLTLGQVSINICSDTYLLKMNKKHLNHDYYTDIITFDYSSKKVVSGDLFISIDRVRDNSKKEGKTIYNELCRVMIHGVLHLCGYKDKTPKDATQMRLKEDVCLSLLSN